MRDSGLDISYALRPEAIAEKRASFQRATENGFKVGTYQELIPTADLVINLTPDKQHSKVVADVMPLMKKILHLVTHTVSTLLKWVSKSVKTSL